MNNKKNLALLFIPLILVALAAVMILAWKKEKVVLQPPVLVQEKPLVTYTEGECFYKTKDLEDWSALETGTRLTAGTTLKTGGDGRIDVRLNKESVIRMGENTLTALDQVTIKTIQLSQKKGRLYTKFHRLIKDQAFRVKTDHTTAGIRGTELVFDVSEEKTVIYALTGITEVRGNGGGEPLLLSYNSYTTVKKGGQPEAPRKISEGMMTDLRDRLNSIHTRQVLHISYQILFEPNSAVMLPSSREELEEVYRILEKGRYSVEIAGHTALVGDPGAMYALSMARAEVIRDELVSLGIRPRRLTVQGYGAARPVADNETEEGRAMNRRVEFTVTEP